MYTRPSPFRQVLDFHRKFELAVPEKPTLPYGKLRFGFPSEIVMRLRTLESYLRVNRDVEDVFYGRVQMMIEELREIVEAYQAHDLPNFADGLVDLEYFVLGTAALSGIPHDAVFKEVHEANMRKERVVNAHESRRLNKLDVKKPEGWVAPDVAEVLEICELTSPGISRCDARPA